MITFGKPASYNGQKRINVEPYLPSGHISIRQTATKQWCICVEYSGFNKNGHYRSCHSYMHDSGWSYIYEHDTLRNIKKKVMEILINVDTYNRLNSIIDMYVADIKRSE